jgi:hypothetical protein
MKRLWPCLVAILALSSCTGVEDFGLYWDKGFVDPALEGSWKKLGLPGEDPNGIPGPDVWRFTRNGPSYLLQGINPIDQTAEASVIEQQKADNDRPMSARTLRIGKHLFLIQRDPGDKGEGSIERYEVQRGTLREYWMNNGAALEFIKAKHPTAKNIKKNIGEGEYVVIDTFDDEVFRVLAEIADNPEYWFLNCQYKKVP